jgi:[pyruvate, water dikinase]-phosphate phosphotransferase / [pyruvate, water dikinase] kinase
MMYGVTLLTSGALPRRPRIVPHSQAARVHSAPNPCCGAVVPKRTVFFVSDQTGVTAETMGHSLLTQFDGLEFRAITLPFVATPDKGVEARLRIDATAAAEGVPPIVFSTLVKDDVRDVVKAANGVFLDFFDAFLAPLEAALGAKSSHAAGRAHGMADLGAYTARINATNFALANDDGSNTRDYPRADVILIGVSRSGKTPTCLYMALQYGIYAANYPLTEDDLESTALPAALAPHLARLYGLTIHPDRLQQIRHERRPDSRYASAQQVAFEVRAAEALFNRLGIPFLDTTSCSIEELCSRIMHKTGFERRLRP